MQVTIEWIEQKFNLFNKDYFEGKLPVPEFRVSKNRSRFGAFIIGHLRKRNVSPTKSDIIEISVFMDREEHVFENTLIHELIHMYVYLNNMLDKTSHGPNFRLMMKKINSHGKHEVKISVKQTREDFYNSLQERKNFIILSRLKNGKKGITVCAQTRIFDFDKAFKKWGVIESYEWRFSYDIFFSKYRRIMRPAFYDISDDDFKKAFEISYRFVIEGDIGRAIIN